MATYDMRVNCKTFTGSLSDNIDIEVTTGIVTSTYPAYVKFVGDKATLTKKKRITEPKVYATLESHSGVYASYQYLFCDNGGPMYSIQMLPIGAPTMLHTDGARIYTGNSTYSVAFYTHNSAHPPYLSYTIADIVPEVRNLYPSTFVDETRAATFGWEFYAELPENGIPLVQKSAVLQWKSADETLHEVSINGDTQGYTFTANTFPENESVKWRVQVISDDDIASEWSEWQTVSTVEGQGTVSALYPSDVLVNGEIDNRVSWRYANDCGTEQSAFDLEVSTDGAMWVSLSSQTTSNQFCDVPAGTFTTEKVWLRVRAYNSSGIASEWETSSFTVRSSPSKPSIVSVSAGVDKPVITWESTGQEAYEITVSDIFGEKLYTRSASSTERRHKVSSRLEDGSYIVSLRIKNKYNLSSLVAQRAFTVSTDKPAKPAIQAIHANGVVSITLSNTTDKAVLLRNGVAVADVSGLTIYEDHTAHGKCSYVLRALDSDSFCDSEPSEVTVSFGYALISTVEKPADCLRLIFKAGSPPENSVTYSAESETITFAGRAFPVTEFGEHKAYTKTLFYSVLTEEDLQKLLNMTGKTILWRDRKDKFYAALSDVNFARKRSYIDISFKLTKQEISEEVIYE